MKKEISEDGAAPFPDDPESLLRRLKSRLAALEDPGYAKYVKKSLPGDGVLLGVSIPATREIAKEIAAANGENFLNAVFFEKKSKRLKRSEFKYCEELIALGIVVAETKLDFEKRLDYIAAFVPWIDSWLVCDVFCSSLKIPKGNLDDYWNFLEPFLESERQYELRFAVVAMLSRCLKASYLESIFARIERTTARKLGEYYVDMSIAWLIATAFAKFPDATWRYLRENSLDDFTFNKALQKIVDSKRVDDETKEEIRLLKRVSARKSK